MVWARRLLAVCVALLVLVEGAGVARALGADELIHCCCGAHSIARACRCPSCPVLERHRPGGDAGVQAPRDCDGRDEAGVLAVIAVVPPAPFVVERPARAGAVVVRQFAAPTRLVDAGRPPP